MRFAVALGVAAMVAAMSSPSRANATSTASPSNEDWRADGRCGTRYVLAGGRAGQCDPTARGPGRGPCCSKFGHCGDTAAHCKCAGCTDFRRTGVMQWREDGRCGRFFPMPASGPAKCDPEATARNGRYGPCCSSSGWCGESAAHCRCNGCQDFRLPQLDGNDDSEATTPKGDGEPQEKKNKRTKGQAVKVS